MVGSRKTGEDVALKILGSAGYAAQESETHLKVAQRVLDRTRIVLCQEHFVLSRTDSNVTYKHVVLVLPLRGPSLSTHLGGPRDLSPIACQPQSSFFQAVLSIHDAGLVHRGKSPETVFTLSI